VATIVRRLGFGVGGIELEGLMQKPEVTVVGMPGSIGVVTESQKVGELGHRRVGMLIIDRIHILSARGPDGCKVRGLGSRLGGLGLRCAADPRVRMGVIYG
jgi:hypothetical protein